METFEFKPLNNLCSFQESFSLCSSVSNWNSWRKFPFRVMQEVFTFCFRFLNEFMQRKTSLSEKMKTEKSNISRWWKSLWCSKPATSHKLAHSAVLENFQLLKYSRNEITTFFLLVFDSRWWTACPDNVFVANTMTNMNWSWARWNESSRVMWIFMAVSAAGVGVTRSVCQLYLWQLKLKVRQLQPSVREEL